MVNPHGPQGGSWLPPPTAYAPPTPKRSAIPLVMGILMICFAGLGFLGGLWNLFGPDPWKELSHDPLVRGEFGRAMDQMKTFTTVTTLLGLGVGILHMVAGVAAVQYRRGAPKLASIYAIIAIADIVVTMILMYAWLMPMLDGAPPALKSIIGASFIIGGILGMAWPILVLVLMTRPSAKAACIR
jgi:hypothetical protein